LSETQQDDDSFHPWHIAGFDQCGSERYKKRQNISGDSDTFTVLYEQEQRGESDQFRRIYGSDQESAKSQQKIDDEFTPFKTGITRFDERIAGKSGKNDVAGHLKVSSNTLGDINFKEHENVDGIIAAGREREQHCVDGSDLACDKEGIASSNTSISAAQMERALEEGYEQGKAKGYEEGFTSGMEQGLTRGTEEGYRSGHEKGEQEGYDAGFQQGEEDGKVVTDARALEIITSLEDIFQKLEHSWHNTIKTHESKILSLICKIAEKVVLARVELDEGVVKESILNALATMPEPEEITLNICPDDYEYIEMVKDDLFERVKSLKSVAVVSNPSVTRGGCKIESSKAKVETDIQSRLDQIFSAIMGARLS